MPTDFYRVLGIARNASEDEIKNAYRGLARRYHPDVAADKAAAEAHFKEINEAYSVLSDPAKRQHYDHFGTVPNGAGSSAGGFGGFGGFGAAEGFGDIFDMFFGGGRTQTRQPSGPQRGADLRYDLRITLEEAYAGAQRDLSFDQLAACEACNGSGAQPGTLVQRCDRCNGSGTVRSVRQTPLGQFVSQTTCAKCGGEGAFVPTPCRVCRGHGRVEKHRTLTVKIPPGVDEGSRIRVAGSGETGERGGPPGDLYVYLTVAPHDRFRRDGTDLYTDVPISFTQAALGDVVVVEALDGTADVSIPAGTQTGTTFRVRGRGMPVVRGHGRGDLLATVHVVVPSKLSRRERELLEEYAREGGGDVDDRGFFERLKDAFAP